LALHDPQPFKVVIKPIRSAGSDRVSLCESRDELKTWYDDMMCHKLVRTYVLTACCCGINSLNEIVGTVNKMGMSNYAAVVQEYLEVIP
jgi:glutathione synthase/RimK-type ligase-like ATP-grasp enzyme